MNIQTKEINKIRLAVSKDSCSIKFPVFSSSEQKERITSFASKVMDEIGSNSLTVLRGEIRFNNKSNKYYTNLFNSSRKNKILVEE